MNVPGSIIALAALYACTNALRQAGVPELAIGAAAGALVVVAVRSAPS